MKIRVGPMTYRVKIVDHLIDDSGSTRLEGRVRHGKSEIALDAELDDQQRLETEWHEVLHIILVQAGKIEESRDESLVEVLAHGVLGVLRDNRKWLVQELVSAGIWRGE